MSRRRTASEPSLPVNCSSYSRERIRRSDLVYEKGKDKLAHWIGAWGQDEVCEVLRALLSRCSLSQLEYLWTATESVFHRDFVHTGQSGLFQPLSTPISREITVRLRRSRKPENKRLHRAQSAVVNCEVTTIRSEAQPLWRLPVPEATKASRLPGLQSHPSLNWQESLHSLHSRPHTTQPVPVISLRVGSRSRTHTTGHTTLSRTRPKSQLFETHPTPPSRVVTPVRRHMCSPSRAREVVASMERSAPRGPLSPGPNHNILPLKRAFLPQVDCQKTILNADALQVLTWFSGLTQDWQREEVLQLVISNLDQKELYFLSALLMSHQYRDFISHLPEMLAHRVLMYVPSKDVLRHGCRVSRSWNERCSSEELWRMKCHRGRLGLPLVNFLSWKRLYIDDLALKKNWWRGRHVVRTLIGHSRKVVCVRLNGDLVATGSADRTVRVWRLTNGDCLASLSGHSKAVWCVCFYGNSLLLSGSSDGSIKVWNYRKGICERTLEAQCGPVWALQLKNELLISGHQDKVVI